MFAKGHTINLGRKNPNAGRKKSTKNQIKAIFENLLPDCEAIIGELAFKAENERVRLEACQYIRDCVRGKPHQSQDLRVTAIRLYTGDEYELATRKVLAEDRKLIEQYGGRNGQSVTEGTDTGEGEALQGEASVT